MKTHNRSTDCMRLAALVTALMCGPANATGELPGADRDIGVAGNLFICRGEQGAAAEPFACLHRRRGDRTQVLLYQGGPVPRAIRTRDGTSNRSSEYRLSAHERQVLRFEAPRPASVPSAARYRGTGVCRDERDRPLPCSVFEHAAARQPEGTRYFVFYEPDGSGVRRIDVLSTGRNEHAFEAELAYQLGRALTQVDCCRDAARAWLAHAVTLFPDDPHYRAALTDTALTRTDCNEAEKSEGAALETSLVTFR